MSSLRIIIIFFIVCVAQNIVSGQSDSQLQSRGVKTLESKIVEVKKGKTIIRYKTEKFGSKGELLEYYWTDSLKHKTEWVQYQYNRKGKVTMRTVLNGESGEMESKVISTYNKWGDLTEITSFNARGYQVEKVVMEYNDQNNLILERTFNENNQLQRTEEYTYDNKGLLILKVTKNAEGVEIYRKENTIHY